MKSYIQKYLGINIPKSIGLDIPDKIEVHHYHHLSNEEIVCLAKRIFEVFDKTPKKKKKYLNMTSEEMLKKMIKSELNK